MFDYAAALKIGNPWNRLLQQLKGHSQLWDRADLDTIFALFEKRLPQPEIKSTRRIHVEIRFNPA